jgi:hypothetical protein
MTAPLSMALQSAHADFAAVGLQARLQSLATSSSTRKPCIYLGAAYAVSSRWRKSHRRGIPLPSEVRAKSAGRLEQKMLSPALPHANAPPA